MTDNYRRKVGLALGSGGIRGFAHIGAIKALVEAGIPIDYISGSSIGAWIGAHYALYQDIDRLIDCTVGQKREKLFSFLELTWGNGLVKGKKTEELLNGWLNRATFSDLKIPLRIVATDLVATESYVFSSGSLAFAAHASMAVPGFFEAVPCEDKLLVDGGVSNPVPDNLVREMGADIVIAINLDNYEVDNLEAVKKLNMPGVMARSLEVMRHHLAEYCLQTADFTIQPPLQSFHSWRRYFMENIGCQIIKIGEDEMKKIIPDIKERLNRPK
jgi:NTE family protein